MIQCNCCGGWFHPDEIRECPECGIEVCDGCFENHIKMCRKFDDIDDDHEEELDVPRVCPVCNEPLELNVDYDKTTVMCSNCDYELDVTDEFKNLEEDEESEIL